MNIFSSIIILVVLVMVGCSDAPASAPSTPQANFGAFTPGWRTHGFGLTVEPDGKASAGWRIYKWCFDDPAPPCDEMRDSMITPGGEATLVFDSADGFTATGRVTFTSDPDTLPVGPITLTLLQRGRAALQVGGVVITLCGVNSSEECGGA